MSTVEEVEAAEAGMNSAKDALLGTWRDGMRLIATTIGDWSLVSRRRKQSS